MDKLKINLIPPEIKEKAKKDAKKSLSTRISIGLLGVLILVTIGVIGVSIYQSVTIRNLNNDIETEKSQLSELKDKEAVAYFLKNRIDAINKFSTTQNTQNEVYDLITSLLPPGVVILALQIDKSDKVFVQGETGSSKSLDVLFNNLSDPQTHTGKIASVSIESVSKNRTGVINFTLTINLGKI